jgi:hypothetical protein
MHLQSLARAVVAPDEEVLHFITRQALAGRGIGYVDVHLLASARLTAGTLLWTDDRRLHGHCGGVGDRVRRAV